MKLSTSAVLASVIVAASAAPANFGGFRPSRGNPFARPPPPPPQRNNNNNNNGVVGATFFMTNDESGNFVMASTIARDGTLTTVRAVATGGNGAHGQSDGPDGLFSQGSLKVGGNNLFVTNPGSNTLSMFKLNPRDPANIKLVGQPADTQGEFPMSVAINGAGNLACVLNGGAVNGVACFKPDAKKGPVLVDGTVRNLGLAQTTPATGPAGSASHILFSEDGTQLIAAVKGAPPNAGFLAVWDVAADGTLSEQFNALTPPSPGALPFGMAAVPGTKAFIVTDPAVGFTVMDLAQLGGVAKRQDANATDTADAGAAAGNSTTDAAAAAGNSTADAAAAAGNSTADATADAAAAGAANSTALTGIQSLAASNVVAAGKSSAVTVGGQKAVCWAAFSKATGTFFLTDIGTSEVTEVKVDPRTLKATIVKQYQQTAGSATIDDAVATVNGRDFLYVLAANATAIDVLSLPAAGKAKRIQNVSFAKAAKQIGVTLSPNNVQGMTVFVPK